LPENVTETRISAATEAPAQPSRTPTIDELVQESGFLRSRTRILGDDVEETSRRIGEVQHRAFGAQLNMRARDVAKRPAADLLDQLASQGFAWRDIARLVGVSVPAVRRWRRGESPTGGHLLSISRLVALIDTLRADHLVSDVAAWLEMPLTPDAPLTGIDLAAAGRHADVLELAAEQVSPEGVLDQWQPGWRERYRSNIEVFEAADRELGLRYTTRQDG
jgi:transcriptional regulator with XRE-family HTH domain